MAHLKTARRSSAHLAAQAEHHKQKTRLLALRIAKQERELMLVSDHEAFIDEVVGLMLTKLSDWPARVGGADLGVRRKAETVLRELRTKIAEACQQRADERNEPKA